MKRGFAMFGFGHNHDDDDLMGAAFLAGLEEQSGGTQDWFKWYLAALFIFVLIMAIVVFFVGT